MIDYLPSPTERPVVEGYLGEKGIPIRPDSDNLVALAFKVVHDHHKGLIVFFRVYSGTLKNQMNLLNSTRMTREKPFKLYQVYANDYEERKEICVGDIGAAVGLKMCATGNLNLFGKVTR